ncbi:MAG: sugar ABC transporter permease [SAR324 cluster bacterium]|nr:sugar ABC transporter permease [SAR324 cluster bacterium]
MQKNRNLIEALLFILPALAIYLFYFILPIPTSFYFSLFNWDGISAVSNFIGFDNWVELFQDPIVWKSFGNNVILIFASILIQIPLGLMLGLLISSKLKGVRLYKLLYFLPMMIASVAIAMIWNLVFDPNFGLLNAILNSVGLEQFAMGWLGDPKLALGAIIGVVCWQFTPFYMVIFSAALSGIPEEILEAAYLDGASKIQTFFKITLPLLKSTVQVTMILAITGSLRYFDLIFVMTGGGPNHASELLATYMYRQAFTSFRMGYGSTIAVFMLMIAFSITFLILRNRKQGILYGE